MAHTPTTLAAWITANPNYASFTGTAAGVPLIIQVGPASGPELDAAKWMVWDYAKEFPDTNETSETADITTTGQTSRVPIPIVGALPAATELEISLGLDTDATWDACAWLKEQYQDSLATDGKQLYMGNFLGTGKKTKVYGAQVTYTAPVVGSFPDPISTIVGITPNLGVFNKLVTITVAGG